MDMHTFEARVKIEGVVRHIRIDAMNMALSQSRSQASYICNKYVPNVIERTLVHSSRYRSTEVLQNYIMTESGTDNHNNRAFRRSLHYIIYRTKQNPNEARELLSNGEFVNFCIDEITDYQ